MAEAAARRLLQRVGWSAPPTDPLAIAAELGIVVEGTASLGGSFSGCLMLQGDTFGILYSTAIPSAGFRRFTLGHELGHHQIQRHRRYLFENSTRHASLSNFTSHLWHEVDADHFSAELLMPQDAFCTELARHPSGLLAVKALANTFATSWTSTAIRYARLSPDPAAVVVSQKTNILYSYRSQSLEAVSGAEITSGDRILPGTLTYEFNTATYDTSREEVSGSTPLEAWCPKSRVSAMMTEQVVGLGKYGRTLTVLHCASLDD